MNPDQNNEQNRQISPEELAAAEQKAAAEVQERVDAELQKIKSQQHVTSAADFRAARQKRDEGEFITLGSGLTIKIKRPSVNTMVKTGQLSTELANAAIKVQQGGNPTADDMKKYVEYNERIIQLAVVEPKVVTDPNYDAGEVSVDDFADLDRSEIVLFVNGGLNELAKFRARGQSSTS